jgi:CheY-like chemotaxis protein
LTAADVLAFLALHLGGVQCLLADLGLPDMDGGELAERARDLLPGIRVVLMAAARNPAEQELLQAYRDLPCVLKPVFREKLAETLHQLLGPPATEPSPCLPWEDPGRRRPSDSHPN